MAEYYRNFNTDCVDRSFREIESPITKATLLHGHVETRYGIVTVSCVIGASATFRFIYDEVGYQYRKESMTRYDHVSIMYAALAFVNDVRFGKFHETPEIEDDPFVAAVPNV